MKIRRTLSAITAIVMISMTACGESESAGTASKIETNSSSTVSSQSYESSASDQKADSNAVTSLSSGQPKETQQQTSATDSKSSESVKKNSDGRYEYLVAGRYTIACKTNIYDYVFSAGKYDNFIDLTRMSKDIGFEQAARLSTGQVDPNMAVGFKYYKNGEKKYGIGFDRPNSEYREGMFSEDYDENHGNGKDYTIHFVNDNHSNNYWTGSPDLKSNVLRTSLSFDQIVLAVKGMEEAVAGNESDDWIIAAGITKPKGYSHYYIYY